MRTPAGSPTTQFSIDSGSWKISKELSSRLVNGKLSLEMLSAESRRWDYWRSNVELIHEFNMIVGASSARQSDRIVVIDTGYDLNRGSELNINKEDSIDLTGDGLQDVVFHGTAVSSLINLVAPRAQQIHVKLIGASGTLNAEQFSQRLRTGLDHARLKKASAVNLSINRLNSDGQHLRPGLLCYCEVCCTLSSFVRESQIPVFTSEGNFRSGSRVEGSWTCPASAEYVTTVFSELENQRMYDTNTSEAHGILAPGMVRLNNQGTGLLARLTRSSHRLLGSSFSVPLVVGTHWALRSTLVTLGYPGDCFPPFNQEESDKPEYKPLRGFPLDLMFLLGDERWFRSYDCQAEWFNVVNNCQEGMRRNLEAKRDDDAGLLGCFIASVMYNYVQRSVDTHRKMYVCLLALPLFVSSIRILLGSELGILSDRFLSKAKEMSEAFNKPGEDPLKFAELEELTDWYDKNRFKLMAQVSANMNEW